MKPAAPARRPRSARDEQARAAQNRSGTESSRLAADGDARFDQRRHRRGRLRQHAGPLQPALLRPVADAARAARHRRRCRLHRSGDGAAARSRIRSGRPCSRSRAIRSARPSTCCASGTAASTSASRDRWSATASPPAASGVFATSASACAPKACRRRCTRSPKPRTRRPGSTTCSAPSTASSPSCCRRRISTSRSTIRPPTWSASRTGSTNSTSGRSRAS